MSSLTDFSPAVAQSRIVDFIKTNFAKCHKNYGIVAVSGGIDSAVSLSLLAQALGKDNVVGLMLPYVDQNMEDAQLVLDFCQISEQNRKIFNIQPAVEELKKLPELDHTSTSFHSAEYDNDIQSDSDPQFDNAKQKRLGNIMARVRMIVLYDWATKLNALVCGTENKSEKYLGYFTRFGDQASDLEPIEHLYKTQVLALAQHLAIPARLITKPPSAGLWPGQTDADELGFSYADADLVLEQLVDRQKPADQIVLPNVSSEVVAKVIDRAQSQRFKNQVPYRLS